MTTGLHPSRHALHRLHPYRLCFYGLRQGPFRLFPLPVTDLCDGISDDEDNCTDRSRPNYNDPANTPCSSTPPD